jgi:DNA-3-methyladenine glycosylase
MKILQPTFFNRSSLTVARELLGCYLVREINGKIERYMITETEAYDGEKDLACHASKGRTPRTEVLYGAPAHFYVYLVYGMYWMLNVVTGPKDYPAGVLIRGVEGASGPGRLTKKLRITGTLMGKPAQKSSGLWFEMGEKIPAKRIQKTVRVGIDYAGPVWAKKEWRFVIL